MILTESELQDYIHALYEGDTDTPDSTDDDYLIRRKFINMGIAFWENWRGTDWAELYTTLATVSTGGTTTVSTNDLTSNCPTGFVRTLGFVQLLDANNNPVYFTEIKQSEAQLYINSASGGNVYWITGKPGAYKINWYPKIPSSYNGYTIAYPYYKRAAMITATSDVADPSDHEFLIHYVMHLLYREEDPGKSREELDVAINLLRSMKIKNDIEKPYQDRSFIDKTDSGFGA